MPEPSFTGFAGGGQVGTRPILVDPIELTLAGTRLAELKFGATCFRPYSASLSLGACPRQLPMIDVARLTKTYGDFTAVKDFSFHVAAGEILGLIGPNGAGKTSTLRCIAGIHAPTRGAITIDGHDIVASPVEAKQRIAFIADEPQLFEYLTVTEHLRLAARIYRVADVEPRARALLLEELELTGKEHALPGELSRGMKQKVAIACGAAARPEGAALRRAADRPRPAGHSSR